VHRRREIKLNNKWHQVGLLFFNYHNDERSNIHKMKICIKLHKQHILPLFVIQNQFHSSPSLTFPTKIHLLLCSHHVLLSLSVCLSECFPITVLLHWTSHPSKSHAQPNRMSSIPLTQQYHVTCSHHFKMFLIVYHSNSTLASCS